MHNLNISQLTPDSTPFKVTSVSNKYSRYKRNKDKVYARLVRLRSLIRFRGHDVPSGITQSASGVVTYKKFNPASAAIPENTGSRKRKKPGLAPNQSYTGDKTRLGGTPTAGGLADPSSHPDRGFYENLPFHGIQNPPNKPISIIAPFVQGNISSFISTKPLLPYSTQPTKLISPFGSCNNKSVKRNQSFHGFQANHEVNVCNPQSFLRNFSSPYLSNPNHHFQGMPKVSHVNTGFEYFKGPQYMPESYHNPFLNFTSSNPPIHVSHYARPFGFSCSNLPEVTRRQDPLNTPSLGRYVFGGGGPRVGKTESRIGDAKPSGKLTKLDEGIAKVPNKHSSGIEKRFSSLEIKKHRCYSPTFYSMRCKKHAKKRPVVYALPKRVLQKTENDTVCTPTTREANEGYEELTSSIKIKENNDDEGNNCPKRFPVPAPRCRKHTKIEIIYQNLPKIFNNSNCQRYAISHSEAIVNNNESNINKCSMNSERDLDSSPEDTASVISVIQAQIHNIPNKKDGDSADDNGHRTNSKPSGLDASFIAMKKFPAQDSLAPQTHSAPKLVAVSPKRVSGSVISADPNDSVHNASQTFPLKYNPTANKPKTESPKGALSLQIQARRKSSPKLDTKETKENSSEADDTKEYLPLIPQMPILDTPIKWSHKLASPQQNAFYTLTTPHYRQVTSSIPPRYSATIPHPKHAKLIPRTLFSEQKVSKSKSFTSKPKQKKHFQMPIQKCHSFKFQTAESYFQPIKNIHEENFIRNGYVSDYAEGSHHGRHHKREKPKTEGPLVLRGSTDYQENVKLQASLQNSVQLNYPQPVVDRALHTSSSKPNGVVYADLDMPKSSSKRSLHGPSSSKSKPHKSKSKTEYATLRFNDVGQEIDV